MRDRIREFLNKLMNKECEKIEINDDYFRTKAKEMLEKKGDFYTAEDIKIISKLSEKEREKFMEKMTLFCLKAKLNKEFYA